jgi:hypothetical protein
MYLQNAKVQRELIAVGLFVVVGLAGCRGANVCDMTPEGSVWLTVARLSWAEEKFYKANGRYGSLAEMTNLEPGLPPRVTETGRMGSYTITIHPTKDRYILTANPDTPRANPKWAWFYADETGLITYDRSGPATPASTEMCCRNASLRITRPR